jgi:hypothetical protein
LHFLVRFLGLTGALVLGVGLVQSQPYHLLASWDAFRDALTATGEPAWWPAAFILAGGAAVAFALLVELLVALFFTAGRRSAFGFNAVVQVVLAAVLLVAVNLASAGFSVPVPSWLQGRQIRLLGWHWTFGERLDSRGHYLQIDTTRGRQFTLPPDLRQELAQLDRGGETTVIVYQRHKTFGALTDKPDRYDYAAERKVVEKVKDLVAQLREVGPQLRVEVLDVEEEGFDDKLKRLTKDAPELARAIADAPDNSIFIRSGHDVQRLSFNEFYQLDKVASKNANTGRGNLVLLGQGDDGRGIGPFVNKVLHVEQRRPRVGVLVIHELLTTGGVEDAFTLSGLKKVLTANGFDVRDVVLKKGWDARNLEPAADTFEESQLDRVEAEIDALRDDIKETESDLKVQEEALADVGYKAGEDEAKKLDELTRKYGRLFLSGRVTAAGRKALEETFRRSVALTREELAAKRKELGQKQAERARLDVDRVSEARRLSDVKAKLTYTLADCDLLFIPRLTRRANDQLILPRLYSISREQADAIKDFLRAGKPLFACLGPSNEPPGQFSPPNLGPAGPDDLERLLGDLGIRLGKQTVLFPSDARAYAAERRADPLRSGGSVETPPLDFDSPTARAGDPRLGSERTGLEANPLHEALRVTAHSVGQGFDLRMRYPRPVYYEVMSSGRLKHDPTFLLTATGWNEDNPFPTRERRPRYTPPPPNDPAAGTFDARRRGPFPVGVAVQARVPSWWGKGSGKDAKTVRVAVIGQGEVFVGPSLSPAKERLFLQTANWLLGRDDYLPRGDHVWSYPRIDMAPDSAERSWWLWGTRLGLPALFAYLGFVVLLLRRLR